MTGPGFAPLAVVTRGGRGRVETWHAGAIAVVDGGGEMLYRAGNPEQAFPLRSCAKPFQLLPLVLDGLGAGLARANLAVMMSSHSGEAMHVERVAALLERFGLDAAQLLCGAHLPYDESARNALLRAGSVPSALHSNCSGKHTAMLAVCHHRGWPTQSYVDPDHPLQRRIGALIAALSGQPAPLRHSVDGCSLPTWWVPLSGLARLFGVLAYPARALPLPDAETAAALGDLHEAGTAHPDLVAGTRRLDTRLMRLLGERCFSKGGAAGLHAMAVRPCPRHPNGLGIAIKVADGDSDGRVRAVVAAALLERLGVLPDGSGGDIASPDVRNVRGIVVGRCEPVFSLAARDVGGG